MGCANHPAVEEGLLRCIRCGRDFCADCVIVLQGEVLCGKCKEDHVRDVVSGVQPGLPLASFRRRFEALLVDRGLLTVVSIPLAFFVQGVLRDRLKLNYSASDNAYWICFWSIYTINVIYEALMLATRGQTLGKMLAKIKVVRADGEPLRLGQAWSRAIIRGLFVWFLQIVDYAPAPMTQEKTCIHDLLARTRVVSAE